MRQRQQQQQQRLTGQRKGRRHECVCVCVCVCMCVCVSNYRAQEEPNERRGTSREQRTIQWHRDANSSGTGRRGRDCTATTTADRGRSKNRSQARPFLLHSHGVKTPLPFHFTSCQHWQLRLIHWQQRLAPLLANH